MKMESKFNFMDKCFAISYNQTKLTIKCPFCAGVGKIQGMNKLSRQCPDCYGNGVKYEYKNNSWKIISELTIGEIRITERCEYIGDDLDNIFDNYGNQKAKRKEEYMCYETGIGSGTLWSEENLFATELEAQAECDRLNKIEEKKQAIT